MRARIRLSCGLLLAAGLCLSIGCNELKDLIRLQGALGEKYAGAEVNIDVSGGRRSLELRLSPSAAEGRAYADVAIEAARSARAAYPHPVDQWIVVFGSEKNSGPVHLEWSVGRYEFASSDL